MWRRASNGGTYLLGLSTVGGTMGNSGGHFVREQQKGIPKVSYRALKARGKQICARSLLFHKQNSYIYLIIKISCVRKEKEANV
jgi:hypothetical protein